MRIVNGHGGKRGWRRVGRQTEFCPTSQRTKSRWVSKIAVCGILGAVYLFGADTFEVAAIRQNVSGEQNTHISMPGGGRLVVENASVKTLIRNAYGILAFQFAGGPKWLDDDKFDINAKTGGPETITQERLKPLLRGLLAERFGLKVHWEDREESVFALLIDKGGAKFQEHTDAPGHGMNTSKGRGRARMKGIDVPMDEIASNLGNQLGRFVVDRTGLAGHYDFVMEWDPDQLAETMGPSLFTAVKEQLGLRLEAGKGAVKMLVIDRVDRPSDN